MNDSIVFALASVDTQTITGFVPWSQAVVAKTICLHIFHTLTNGECLEL